MDVVCGRCGTTSAALPCRTCDGNAARSPFAGARRLRSRTLVLIVIGLVPGAGLVLAAVLFAFALFAFRTYFTPSAAMVPTLQIKDVMLVNTIEYHVSEPHDGDIVVFSAPVPGKSFVKRVIGVPGEKLRIAHGTVYRNDVPLVESYVSHATAYDLAIRNYGIYVDGVRLDSEHANVPPRDRWTSADTIPPGSYVMLGDNRNNSEDSHVWGFAERQGTFAAGPEAGHPARFVGHAIYVIWPAERRRPI